MNGLRKQGRVIAKMSSSLATREVYASAEPSIRGSCDSMFQTAKPFKNIVKGGAEFCAFQEYSLAYVSVKKALSITDESEKHEELCGEVRTRISVNCAGICLLMMICHLHLAGRVDVTKLVRLSAESTVQL